jgi:ribosome-associated protein
VNKVASKIDLRFDLEASRAIPPEAKERLRKLARGRLDAAGRVIVTSQKGRDQAQNLEDARDKLAALVRAALVKPKRRRPTRPSKASKRRRLEEKKRKSAVKAGRGRVRDHD